MDKNFSRKFLFSVFWSILIFCPATKSQEKDSLLKIIKTSQNQAKKINALLKLSDQETKNPKGALAYSIQALEISNQIEDGASKLNALIRISQIHFMLSDVKSAIESGLEAQKIALKYGKQPELAIVLDGLGMLYYNLGDKKKCADYYFSSLKISELLSNKNLISLTLSRIGLLYNDQKDYKKADEYLKRSLTITRELNNKEGIATNRNR